MSCYNRNNDYFEDKCLVEESNEPIEKNESFKNNVSQYSINGSSFIPCSKTIKILPKGYYYIKNNPQIGIYFEKQEIYTNKLYKLPNKAVDTILYDIDKFWKSKEQYIKYNRVYRRNYLIYSAPGTGKTSLINLMCEDLINLYDGVIISIRAEDEIYLYYEAMKQLRIVEPDRKIIVIIEDIDNFIGNGQCLESELLNILDGNLKFNNTVIIGTTNYPEKMTERYINRPSRFDNVIEFPLPNEDSRKMFIECSVHKDDLSKINVDKWVENTKGYTIDHINELILLHFVFGHSEEESFERIDAMAKRKGILKNEDSLDIKNKKIGIISTTIKAR